MPGGLIDPITNAGARIVDFGSLLSVSAIVIVTPGQDTVLTIRNTLLGGRSCGAFTALGVSAGQAAWALATSVGLAALLAASEPAFTTLRLGGAAYMVYLGAQALHAAIRHGGESPGARPPHAARERLAPIGTFGQGFLSNLGNPKTAVFFVSLLPQFASHGPPFVALLSMGLIFCTMTLGWLTVYAIVVDKAGDVLRRPRIRRAIDSVSAVVLLALGIQLAAQSR